MLTPQEVQNKKFVKAVFGGYDMTMVDEFLEELQADYTTLFKENAVLKGKLKVLVDKIEEYRSVDEDMRKALLVAQQMAAGIVSEAQAKSTQMVAQAKQQIEAELSELRVETERENARLNEAKREAADFIYRVKDMCTKELALLTTIGEKEIELYRPMPDAVADKAQEIASRLELTDERSIIANIPIIQQAAQTDTEPVETRVFDAAGLGKALAQAGAEDMEDASKAEADGAEFAGIEASLEADGEGDRFLELLGIEDERDRSRAFSDIANGKERDAGKKDAAPRFDFENLQFEGEYQKGK